jgi:hypothetical protein
MVGRGVWKSRRRSVGSGSGSGNSMKSNSKKRVKRGPREGTEEDEETKESEGEEQEHEEEQQQEEEDEEEQGEEESENGQVLGEGFYEVEDIRKKRIRKVTFIYIFISIFMPDKGLTGADLRFRFCFFGCRDRCNIWLSGESQLLFTHMSYLHFKSTSLTS